MISSKQVVLVGDWNTVLDPELDLGSASADTNIRCKKLSGVHHQT